MRALRRDFSGGLVGDLLTTLYTFSENLENKRLFALMDNVSILTINMLITISRRIAEG